VTQSTTLKTNCVPLPRLLYTFAIMRVSSRLIFFPAVVLGAAVLPPSDDSAQTNSYIAVLKPVTGVSAASDVVGQAAAQQQASVGDPVTIGSFTAVPLEGTQAAIDAIANIPQIAYIEPNYKVRTTAIIKQQNPPNWGLARLSSHVPGAKNYFYDDRAGEGSFAYIIDTGVLTTHPDFEGRASLGTTFVDNETTDGNGHGTHVAGIVGSKTYGVAKKVSIIAVKALDDTGSGYTADVISAIQWSVSDAQNNGRVKRSVINMSLAGPKSQVLTDAVNAAAAAGVFVACAAGNSNAAVKKFSPANARDACTVAATNADDSRADYSNFGKLVDIFAPGTAIVSTWNDGTSATLSGTSMASPHVAGLAAYMLSIGEYRAPGDMCKYLKSISTKGKIVGAGVTKNQLAFNGASNV